MVKVYNIGEANVIHNMIMAFIVAAPSLGTQTPRRNGRGVWAPGLPGCVSVRRDVGVPVIAIITVYDVSAAQLF